MADSKDSPAYTLPEIVALRPFWKLCEAAFGGIHSLRNKEYMPQHPAEHAEDYKDRLLKADGTDAFEQTVEFMTGQVCGVEPHLGEDVPEVIKAQWESLDNFAQHGAVFSRIGFGTGLVYGKVGILVDLAEPPAGPASAANAPRPYWSLIQPDQINNYSVAVVDGALRVVQLVLQAEAYVRDGQFGRRPVIYYYVYEDYNGVVTVERWVKENSRDEATVDRPKRVVQGPTRIPVAWANFGPRAKDCGDGFLRLPPLRGMAEGVVCYVNVQSDHRWALYKASVPLLHVAGRDPALKGTALTISPNSAIETEVGGLVEYVEHSGSALGQTRMELQDLGAKFASYGLAMLYKEKQGGPETAASKRIDAEQGSFRLVTAKQSWQDCLETALGYHAAFLGLGEDAGGSLTLPASFDTAAPDQAFAAFLVGLVEARIISRQTARSLLAASGQAGNLEPDEEAEQVDTEDAVALDAQTAQADADAERADAAAEAARQAAPPPAPQP